MFKGVSLSLFSSLFFGTIYYIATLLQPLSGQAVLGFRIIAIIPFIILALFIFNQKQAFIQLIQRIKTNPKIFLILFITGINTGFQMWLFMWAPNNNKGIDVSMGYLIMPMVMVVIGRWLYKEHLTKIKLAAVLFALIGVVVNVVLTQTISWEMFAVCLGYPLYFTLRKSFTLNHLSGFLIELFVLLPFCFYFISQENLDFVIRQNANLYYFIGLLGLVSGIAFTSYIAASNLLPMNLLGMLGYCEPFFMLLISYFIGERLAPESYFLMGCLILSIFCLMLDSFVNAQKQKRFKPLK